MKKTYSNPQMEIVKIQTQQMLADSLTYNSTPVSAGSVDARGFNFDPDEE